MIDLAQLRKNPQQMIKEILKKDPSYNAELLITLDADFRKLSLEVEQLRYEKNEIAKSVKGPITDEIRQKSIEIGKSLKAIEIEKTLLQKEIAKLVKYLAITGIVL